MSSEELAAASQAQNALDDLELTLALNLHNGIDYGYVSKNIMHNGLLITWAEQKSTTLSSVSF